VHERASVGGVGKGRGRGREITGLEVLTAN